MVKFESENFCDVEPELKELILEHWEEVTSDPDLPLDPAWESYQALASSGRLLVVTARHEGKLVGYIIHILHNPLHYRYLWMAMDDAHFLRKEHRRGLTAVRMFQATEKILKERGVAVVSYHSKARDDLNKTPVFKRMGYRLKEFIFTKRL